MFDQYGIQVPTTWDEFAAAARKLHAANPNVYLTNIAPNQVAEIFEPGHYGSSEPRYALAADKALRQAISAALRPSSADSAPPTRPTYCGSCPTTGNMPLRKSRLPILTVST